MNTYAIELNRWYIKNDGTNPVETTRGLNNALVWASANGYNECTLEDGTYVISKDDHIKMVSDMTFTLSSQAVLQKETNGYSGYKVLEIGIEAKNVTLRGGTYKGDKDTHSYASGGTHESGYGIVTSGAQNVLLDGVKAVNFTGDGLVIGSVGSMIQDLYSKAFVTGDVLDDGSFLVDGKKSVLRNLPITHPYFSYQKTFQFLHVQNFPQEASGYQAFFYDKDGKFIGKLNTVETNTPVGWGLSVIPDGAVRMDVVFPIAKMPSNVYVEYWMQGVSKDVAVRNSEFAFNRRQGITIGGAQNVIVENCKLHDMKGTAPQSGIDVEAGYHLNNGINILNNSFYNNQAYDLILFDGRNAVVKGNTFSSSSIGLAVSEPFKYAEITGNAFDGARIYAYNYATFKNNKMKNALAAFLGSNTVIDGMEFQDTLVNIAASTPFGIAASNIKVVNTNKKIHTQFGVNSNPIKLTNVTITGANALDSFGGNAANGSVFEAVKVLGYTRTQIPRGTYNNCVFESATAAGPEINNDGMYVFNNCTVTTAGTAFEVNNVHGIPDQVSVTHSILKTTKDGPMAVSIQAGKQISFEGNTITAGNISNQWIGAFKVNNYWEKDKQFDIGALTVRNNTIITKGKDIGISTIHAGVGAPPYIIEGNTLVNCKLELKANDVNFNNKEQ